MGNQILASMKVSPKGVGHETDIYAVGLSWRQGGGVGGDQGEQEDGGEAVESLEEVDKPRHQS